MKKQEENSKYKKNKENTENVMKYLINDLGE